MKDCFAWDAENNKCMVIGETERITMYIKNADFCCTMKCPFYKTDRKDTRLHDRILKKGVKR